MFQPSKHKPNQKYYFDKVRAESLTRRVVKINNRNIIFGVEGPIILSEGKFWSISAEVENGRWGKHWIMVAPDLPIILRRKSCFLRIDSGCLSGILGDITCDCMEQFKTSQREALKKQGIIIYIPNQDGRGHGSEFKMANQRLMNDCRMDTIAVAERFYRSHDKIDIRTFDEAVIILQALGFPRGYKFYLGTKNPRKVQALLEGGYVVEDHEISTKKEAKFLKINLKAKYKFFEEEKRNMRPIKKDKFFRDRESTYTILAIGCVKCGENVLLYQKDGRGNLKRLYLNRILFPENLASLQDTVKNVKKMKALKCKCGQLIGLPMLHREGRLAFRLIQGNYTKRRHKL